MPTDQSTAPATTTSRRTFLTRSLGVGALVTTGALAGTATGLLPSPPAGAEGLTDADFGDFAVPLELAAAQVCQAALDGGKLDSTWTSQVETLQSHHQTSATSINGLRDPDADALAPDADFAKTFTSGITGASSQEDVLTALAKLEDTISATHLLAIGSIDDAVTARVASQILAGEAQAAAVLAVAGGAEISAVTPDVASTADGVRAGN